LRHARIITTKTTTNKTKTTEDDRCGNENLFVPYINVSCSAYLAGACVDQ
jgi:hypothetical protein